MPVHDPRTTVTIVSSRDTHQPSFLRISAAPVPGQKSLNRANASIQGNRQSRARDSEALS